MMNPSSRWCASTLALALVAGANARAHAARLAPVGVRASGSDVAAPALRPRSADPAPGHPGFAGLSIRVGTSRIALRAQNLPMAGDDLVAFARVTGHDVSQVDFHEQLVTVTPSLHVGGSGYFFRVDAPLGFSSSAQTFGLGVYPVNVGVTVPAARVMPYAGAGVVGSFVVGDSAAGAGGGTLATGGLFQARTALGVKLLPGNRTDLSLEFGYSPWAVGGVVNPTEFQRAASRLERGLQIGDPARVMRAGAGNVWDLSVGVGWL
jgi:hypothetical protein